MYWLHCLVCTVAMSHCGILVTALVEPGRLDDRFSVSCKTLCNSSSHLGFKHQKFDYRPSHQTEF